MLRVHASNREPRVVLFRSDELSPLIFRLALARVMLCVFSKCLYVWVNISPVLTEVRLINSPDQAEKLSKKE